MIVSVLILSALLLPASLNAQCQASNDAFKSGELLTYDLHFNWKFVWLKAGKAYLTTTATTYNSKPAYRFTCLGVGSKKVDFFFKMRDTLTAIVSNKLEPIYFRKGAEEGSRYTVDEAWYSYSGGKSRVRQKRFYKGGEVVWTHQSSSNCIFDMLSILGQARSYQASDFKVGEKIHFAMTTGRDVEEQTLVYRGIKDVQVENKITYRCLVFSFVEYKNGKEKEVITFYISDDRNHIPVRLDMFLKIGSAKAYLRSATGTRYPVTSIVSRK